MGGVVWCYVQLYKSNNKKKICFILCKPVIAKVQASGSPKKCKLV